MKQLYENDQVFGLAFPAIFGKAPVINNPITTPKAPATMMPPLAANHQRRPFHFGA
jgi:hypothetical protein